MRVRVRGIDDAIVLPRDTWREREKRHVRDGGGGGGGSSDIVEAKETSRSRQLQVAWF